MDDFTDVQDIAVQLIESTDEAETEFADVGDFDSIVVSAGGFGEDGFGEGPFGGSVSTIVTVPTTTWTDVETP